MNSVVIVSKNHPSSPKEAPSSQEEEEEEDDGQSSRRRRFACSWNFATWRSPVADRRRRFEQRQGIICYFTRWRAEPAANATESVIIQIAPGSFLSSRASVEFFVFWENKGKSASAMVLPRINPDLLLAAQLPVVICCLPLLFLWTLLAICHLSFLPLYARNLYLPRRFVRPISERGFFFDANTRDFVLLVASLRQKSNRFCLQFRWSCMSGIYESSWRLFSVSLAYWVLKLFCWRNDNSGLNFFLWKLEVFFPSTVQFFGGLEFCLSI